MAPDHPTAHVPTSGRIVFSHRGLNRQAPENTMPAFELTAEAGLGWLETDVNIIGDGTPVIIHDSTLDRTTDCQGSIYDLVSEDLAGIDAGRWFDPRYRDTRIPTLAQFIDFLNERQMNCNIELKSHELGEDETLRLIEAVAKELQRLDPEREIIVSSFSQLALQHFHQHAPQYAVGVLWETESISDDWLSVLELVGASYVHLDDAGLSQECVRSFRDAGYGVNVWTVNSKARANQLFNWGCMGIFTDIADQFLQ